jgi:ATP phosphoribosyltransferase
MTEYLKFSVPQTPTDINLEQDTKDRVERFRNANIKIGVQKNGELTEISTYLINQLLGIDISEVLFNDNRKLFGTVNYVGLALLRNKSICPWVAQGLVDIGIVGVDQLIESRRQEQLDIVLRFDHVIEWDLVLATSKEREFSSIEEIAVVATQYPIIAVSFFTILGQEPTIIPIEGSAELMPWLKSLKQDIDAIIDIRVSGETLAANGLVAWEPPVTKIYPVLVANKEALQNKRNESFFEKLKAPASHRSG